MSDAASAEEQRKFAARQERLKCAAELTAAAKLRRSSAGTGTKRPADEPSDARPSIRPKRSSGYFEVPPKDMKETELADLERGLEPYDWKKPKFRCSDVAPRIVYLDSNSDAEIQAAIDELLQRPGDASDSDPLVLGLDMEWKVTFTMGSSSSGVMEGRTALVQLCSKSLIVFLHLAHMVPFTKAPHLPALPLALETFLRRTDIYKTGVKVEGDAMKLQKEFGAASGHIVGAPVKGVCSARLLELSRLAQQVDPDNWSGRGRSLISLRELTAVYLGRKLVKSSARTSDWSKRPLSDEQLNYAANDVMSGLEVYEALRRRAAAREGNRLHQLLVLPKRRDYRTVKDDQELEMSQGSQDYLDGSQISQAASFDAGPQVEVAESQQSVISVTSDHADVASAPASQLIDGDLGESQVSLTNDHPLGGESQLESQMSVASDASSSRHFSFLSALDLSSTDLTDEIGLPKTYKEWSRTISAPPK